MKTPIGNRFNGKPVKIEQDTVRDFFKDRASRAGKIHPLAPVIYQDNHPELALERDKQEKSKLLPYLKLTGTEQVLDIGCGIGRWADAIHMNVASYLGLDYTEEFISVARKKYSNRPNIRFEVCNAVEFGKKFDLSKIRFDVAIFAGIFIYLNDDQIPLLLDSIVKTMNISSRILIREPIAIRERLTLDRVWSDDMNCSYSAVYRSEPEIMDMIARPLSKVGFQVTEKGPLYDAHLNNRNETKQYFFLLERQINENKSVLF